jgi:hypothetical protein
VAPRHRPPETPSTDRKTLGYCFHRPLIDT